MDGQFGMGYRGQSSYGKDRKLRPTLQNYNGPYDRSSLRTSSYDLMSYIDRSRNSQIWHNINSKTNIYGFLYSSTTEDGYGESSTAFSHAGVPDCEYNQYSAEDHHSEDAPSTSASYTIDDLSSMTNFAEEGEIEEGEITDSSKVDVIAENVCNEHIAGASTSNLTGYTSTRGSKNSKEIDNLILSTIPSSVAIKGNNDATTEPLLQEDDVDECPDDNYTKPNAVSCEKTTMTKNTARIDTVEDETNTSGKDVIYVNDSEEEAEPILIEEKEGNDGSSAKDTSSNVDNDIVITGVSLRKDSKAVLNENIDNTDNFNNCDTSLTTTAKSINHSTGANFIDLSKVVDIDPEDEPEVIDNSCLKEMYQCEFCKTVTVDENEMKAHLRQELHSSASLVLATSEKKVLYLCQPSVLRFRNAIFKRMAAICPENNCSCLFSSVGACESHVTLCHAQGKVGGYGLADVIDCRTVSVSASDNVCDECGIQFKRLKSLERHYQTTNHKPFVFSPDGDTYIACDYCHSVFFAFKDAVQHVRIHTNLISDGKLNLLVLAVCREKHMMEFPPYTKDKQGEYNYLSSKIRGLKDNKKMCGKSGRKRNRRAIKKLKDLLKIVAKS